MPLKSTFMGKAGWLVKAPLLNLGNECVGADEIIREAVLAKGGIVVEFK